MEWGGQTGAVLVPFWCPRNPQVGYLPDGTPMNKAGNCINHPETIGPDPHAPGAPIGESWWPMVTHGDMFHDVTGRPAKPNAIIGVALEQ